ncbi:MAG TPA: MFS transporter, partial [Caulobacteraceae bacterium]|nr:MFS transporter [Caulobacteraceae bacterium]
MTVQPPGAQGKASVYSYFIVCVLAVVYTFNFLDRQLMSILQESIRADLHLSDTELGMVTGLAFALVYTFLGIPIAWLADRTHRVRIIATACAVWSLFSATCGLATSFPMLALARLGVGLGEAGGSPPSYSVIADYFPPNRRGVGLALYSTGVPLGTMFGSAVGAWIDKTWGWRTAFFAVGAPGVALALLVLILVREPPRGRFDAKAPGQDNHAAGLSLPQTIVLFFRNNTLALTALSSGLTAFVGYAMLNWAPSFLIRVRHMGREDIALYYSLLVGATGVVGTFGSGWLVDRLGRMNRRAYALVPMISILISLPFYVLFVWAPTWPLALCFLSVPAVLLSTYLAPALAVVQNAVPPAQRGASSAVLLFVLNLIGLGGGPVFVGRMSDFFKPSYG